MKVLWITNIIFPEALGKLSGCTEFKSSGGWMLGLADAIVSTGKVELIVAAVSPLVKNLTKLTGKNITYYVLPLGKGNTKENQVYRHLWKQIYSEVEPEIVHLHGTECSHGLAYMNEIGVDNVVVSIQGLLSSCAEHYSAGLSKFDVYMNLTPRDLIKGSIITDQRRFKQRSKYESKILKVAKYFIGRTSWDKAKTITINPFAQYFYCNEILRNEFYCDDLWKYENCSLYSIFISQAGYPLKGFHQVLKAMPIILSKYPYATIRVAGPDITKCESFNDLIHFTGYGRYLKRLIKKLGLDQKVTFLGPLSAMEMKQEYLNCNVFVCPSSIENSPNSLGEAQILGVPCVASCVGGVPDMMAGNEENLYRFDDIEMLAHKICDVFANIDKPNLKLVKNALARHNPDTNAKALYEIYCNIMMSDKDTICDYNKSIEKIDSNYKL